MMVISAIQVKSEKKSDGVDDGAASGSTPCRTRSEAVAAARRRVSPSSGARHRRDWKLHYRLEFRHFLLALVN